MKRISAPAEGMFKRHRMPEGSTIRDWTVCNLEEMRSFLNGYVSDTTLLSVLSEALRRNVTLEELEDEAKCWTPLWQSTDSKSSHWGVYEDRGERGRTLVLGTWGYWFDKDEEGS